MKSTKPEAPATKEQIKAYDTKDIIVKRVSYQEERDSENNRVIKRLEKNVNLTKKINETAKAVKVATALEKINQAEKELLNKGVL